MHYIGSWFKYKTALFRLSLFYFKTGYQSQVQFHAEFYYEVLSFWTLLYDLHFYLTFASFSLKASLKLTFKCSIGWRICWRYLFDDCTGKDGSKVTTVVATPGQGPDRPQEVSYTDTKVIGNGSFGVVYQARLCDTSELVAIKKVLQDKRFKVCDYEISCIVSCYVLYPCVCLSVCLLSLLFYVVNCLMSLFALPSHRHS